MEIKINLMNLEDAKKILNNLQNQLDVKNSVVSDCMVFIRESSGGTCDEVNEIYRSLKRIEVALSQLIDTTKICVDNGKVIASKTDIEIGKTFEDTYSGNSIGKYSNISSNFLLSK